MDCGPPGSSVRGTLQAGMNGLPVPPPGDLPNPGIEPASLALAQILLPPRHWDEIIIIGSI